MREAAMEILNSPECQWTVDSVTREIEYQKKVIEYWNSQSMGIETKHKIQEEEYRMELLNAIYAILKEGEVEQEAAKSICNHVGEVSCGFIRKTVAVMANKLCKTGISLSTAFKRAWTFVKFCVSHQYFSLSYTYFLKQHPMRR